MHNVPLLAWRYEHVAVVGKGGFGIVSEHVDRFTGEHVAVKTIPSRFVNQESARLVREIDIMSFLHDAHPHVIGYFDMFATPSGADNVLSQDEGGGDGATTVVDAHRFDAAGPQYPNLSRNDELSKYHDKVLSMVNRLSGEDEFSLHIVMPLMKGDLLYFIKHVSSSGSKPTMTDEFIELVTVVFAFQICFGLDFLHKCNIVHRDIKPENILVRLHGKDPYKSTALIADFGLARDAQASDTFYVCTRYYRPPEIVTNVSGGEPSIDVWSVGCILFEMVTGKALFNVESALNEQGVWDGQLASTQLEVILNIVGTPSHDDIRRFMPVGNAQNYLLRSAPRPSRLVGMMNEQWRLHTTRDRQQKWIDLISSCLAFFPQQRPTCGDLCRHELFQEYNLFYGGNVMQYQPKRYQSAEVNTLKTKNKQSVLHLVRLALQKHSPVVDVSFSDGAKWKDEDEEEGKKSPCAPKERFLDDGELLATPEAVGSDVQHSDMRGEGVTPLEGGSEEGELGESVAFRFLKDSELRRQYDNWGWSGRTRDEVLAKILGDLQRYTHDAVLSEQLRELLRHFSSPR
ncbi:protein kinase, putative [Trypanosoma brucei gambiense DAL972]|uniref:Protein kinase, putative n=1 Tax=Trypanosoma brucei gambiense (strain MHOM/CI/86/DAL972) TaxID=679716 RepID=D0A4N2_TRYB9|nr:protein kinase, putative [Trypanosoma brucei gambiense DAL972]CBH16226.1 protein kinase, putative [Trypanosoma brucei gambiense DAL972]|eukprot:XP_011778490.1 protein kinase, putative [Trypanosoma brucei gambiense DAL972]